MRYTLGRFVNRSCKILKDLKCYNHTICRFYVFDNAYVRVWCATPCKQLYRKTSDIIS